MDALNTKWNLHIRAIVLKGGIDMSDSSITKMALANAMKELMTELPLHKVSISNIVEKCNLSRKSFYYHFKDKYDLVNWIFYTDFVSNFQKNTDILDWNLIKSICEFFYENKFFYSNVLEVRGQNSFYDYFGEILSPIIELHFEDMFEESEDKNFYVIFFTDTIRTSIARWLLEGAKISPNKYVKLLKTAVTGIALKIVEDMDLD